MKYDHVDENKIIKEAAKINSEAITFVLFKSGRKLKEVLGSDLVHQSMRTDFDKMNRINSIVDELLDFAWWRPIKDQDEFEKAIVQRELVVIFVSNHESYNKMAKALEEMSADLNDPYDLW